MAAAQPLPDPLRVLAVSADGARHAPVRALLRSAEIEHVTTPDAALEALKHRRHDVSLVGREIEPPGMDGLALAEELVRRVPRVPVIVLSHAADREAGEEAAEAGIADFLLVPELSAD